MCSSKPTRWGINAETSFLLAYFLALVKWDTNSCIDILNFSLYSKTEIFFLDNECWKKIFFETWFPYNYTPNPQPSTPALINACFALLPPKIWIIIPKKTQTTVIFRSNHGNQCISKNQKCTCSLTPMLYGHYKERRTLRMRPVH